MFKKIVKYISLSFFLFLTGIFLFAFLSRNKTETPSQLPNQKTTEKKIVANLTESKIILYENGEVKKTIELPFTKDALSLNLPSGIYPMNLVSSSKLLEKVFRLNQKTIEEIFNFNGTTSNLIVFNETKEQKTSIDAQGLYFLKKQNISEPKLTADAVFVGDIDSGSALYQKNGDKKYPIASVTKLMTALVTLKSLDQHKQIKITKEILAGGYGDYGYLRLGETLMVGELIFPLLLSSSNDAAMALAIDYGEEKFVKLMNNEAADIGLSNTSFGDSSGIGKENVSTSEDLFRLAQHIFNKERFIFDTTKLKSINNWRNNNFFADDPRYLGGKSGYTDPAGETLVSVFSLPLSESQNRNIAVVLLHSKDREADAQNILKWLNSETYYQDGLTPQRILSEEDIKNIEKELSNVSFLFVGDMMFDRGVRDSVLNNATGDFSFLFKKTDFIKEVDVAFGNLEGPVSDVGKEVGNLYSFRMHPTVLSALKETGFDVLSVANNHIADWGRTAFEDTLFRLKNEDIVPVDADLNIIEKNGIKIGFLGFSDVGPPLPEILLDKSFGDKIKNASEKTDILVVSLHFGEEYQKIHNKRQEELAHLAIDNGAKIVIGHHPHVVQDIENYKDGVIAYSLGNFIFDQNFSEDTMKGLALEVAVFGNGEIKSVKNIPIKINNFFQPELISQ